MWKNELKHWLGLDYQLSGKFTRSPRVRHPFCFRMIVVTGGTLNRRVRRVAKFGRKIRRRRSQKGKNPKPNSKSGYVRHGKSFPDPVNFAPSLIILGNIGEQFQWLLPVCRRWTDRIANQFAGYCSHRNKRRAMKCAIIRYSRSVILIID